MSAKAMRDVLLENIWQAMEKDEKIYFVAADFGSPVLDKIRADYPNRFVNVGIAEQNLINVSAGLALEGYKVFAYAIAPFITMRCYEQVRTNIALLSTVRDMNVNLIGVGAGYSYVVSGPTHQCYEDITLMRMLPGATVYSPADHVTAGAMFDLCANNKGLKYVRLDAQMLESLYEEKPAMNVGFETYRDGQDVCLVATGFMSHTARKAAQLLEADGKSVGVIDLFDLSSFDDKALAAKLAGYKAVISLEEAFKECGGLDALVSCLLNKHQIKARFASIGVPRQYSFELGSRAELHALVGIDVDAVVKQANEIIA